MKDDINIRNDNSIKKDLKKLKNDLSLIEHDIFEKIKKNIAHIRISKLVKIYHQVVLSLKQEYKKIDFEKYIDDIRRKLYFNHKTFKWLGEHIECTSASLSSFLKNEKEIFSKKGTLFAKKIKVILGIDIKDYYHNTINDNDKDTHDAKNNK